MDPLERAHAVLARAAAASSAAAHVLPARAALASSVHAHTAQVASLRAAARAHAQACTAAQRSQVEAESAAALSRARLLQLMRLTADALGAVLPDEVLAGCAAAGLAAAPPLPVDDPALPYSLREPLKQQARLLAGGGAATPFLAGRARSRLGGGGSGSPSGGGGAVGALALTRPDVLEAAQAGAQGGDEQVLGERGHGALLALAAGWVRGDVARRERMRQ
jgi:hypothetical protein